MYFKTILPCPCFQEEDIKNITTFFSQFFFFVQKFFLFKFLRCRSSSTFELRRFGDSTSIFSCSGQIFDIQINKPGLSPTQYLFRLGDIYCHFFRAISSQDSSVGSTLDWYSEGPGFKSRRLQLNVQLEKGCGRDSMQYAINYGCVELNLNNIKCSVRGYVHVVYCKAAYKDPQNF